MAKEIEVVRLVSRFVGENKQFKQVAKETETVVNNTKKALDKALDKAKTWGRKLWDTGRSIFGANRELRSLGETAVATAKSVGMVATKLTEVSTATKLVIGGASAAAQGLLLGGLMQAGQFEQTSIAFETLIGNVKEAKQTMADLTEFAALTPFEMPEIEVAARGLLTFGERGKELMETLNILGNAASGTSSNFGEIALIFNQIRGVGKLLTQDFRQLSTRGVLFLQDIAKYYKVTDAEANAMISSGKVGFEDLRNILKGLSEDGGRFANMMEKQSKSLLGLWSTFKDAVNLTKRDLGEQFVPAAKAAVEQMIKVAEVIRNLPPSIKTLMAAVLALTVAVGTLATAWTFLGGAFMTTLTTMKAIGVGLLGLIARLAGVGATSTATAGSMMGLNFVMANTATLMTTMALGIGGGIALWVAYKAIVKDVSEEINQANQAHATFLAAHQSRFTKVDQEYGKMSGDEQRRAVGSEIDTTAQKIEIMKERLNQHTEALQKAQDENEKHMGANWVYINQLKKAEQQYNSTNETLAMYQDRLTELKKRQAELNDVQDAGGNSTAKQAEEAMKYAEEQRRRMEYERYTLQGGTDSQTVFEMMQNGVPPEIVNQARQYDNVLKQIEERKKQAQEEERKRQEKITEAEREKLELQKRAQQIIKQNLTPQEKLKETVAEIVKFQQMGLLTQHQANRAISEAVLSTSREIEKTVRNVPTFGDSLNRLRSKSYGRGSDYAEYSSVSFRRAQYERLGYSPERAAEQTYRDAKGAGKTDADRIVNVLERIETLLEQGRGGEAIGLINSLEESGDA